MKMASKCEDCNGRGQIAVVRYESQDKVEHYETCGSCGGSGQR